MRLAIDAPQTRRPAPTSRTMIAALAVVAATAIAAPCRADLQLSLTTPTATAPGSSGTFQVLLSDTDPTGSTPYNVAADSFELTVGASTDVSFTNVTIPTNGTYIYAASFDNDDSFALNDGTYTLPGPTFIAFDSGDNTYTTLNPGDSYSLGQVSYSISGAASTGDQVAINFSGLNVSTSLSDPYYSTIQLSCSDVTSGTITITPAVAAVPEPPTSWICVLAAAAVGAAWWSRRRAAGATRTGRATGPAFGTASMSCRG